MKIIKLFLIALFIMQADLLALDLNPFNNDDDKPKQISSAPRICFYSILVKDMEKGKIFYIFTGACGGFKQVGIVDEVSRLIIEVTELKMSAKTQYYGNNKKNALISEKWGTITPIDFFGQ